MKITIHRGTKETIPIYISLYRSHLLDFLIKQLLRKTETYLRVKYYYVLKRIVHNLTHYMI